MRISSEVKGALFSAFLTLPIFFFILKVTPSDLVRPLAFDGDGLYSYSFAEAAVSDSLMTNKDLAAPFG
ncbi:MAG: hypothetical protein SGI71_01495 [Verrucomicrobiota bacterium]|nr:hypothetical protein [Verrucomicrobiota bacterium]